MKRLLVLVLLCRGLAAAHAGVTQPIQWQTSWTEAQFAQAAREHKFVLLDLHAVWCHWCHVMDDTTYSDAGVRQIIAQHFVPVSIDSDADPALTSRYGDWGWPATIVLTADGSEIVKRRGYIPPAQMASLLQAIVADPSPGPSVNAPLQIATTAASTLDSQQRSALGQAFDAMYDETHAGWGDVHKYIDAAAIELSFARLDAGDQTAVHKIRRTLDANQNLIDPVWGGVYQYSDQADWRSPHYEKLLSFQADDLRIYSEAYARWQRKGDLEAAQKIYSYLTGFLSAPDGGFYVSQDADLSAKITGHDFYARDDAGRRALGIPRIDTHEYSRETGWAIRALCKYYDVTGEKAALRRAVAAAQWARKQRARAAGGFGHGSATDGPYLDDNISMAAGFVALYRSTGQRAWLPLAVNTLHVIDTQLRDSRGGYIASHVAQGSRGVLAEAVRDPGQNMQVVRTANMLAHYTGTAANTRIAQHAMRFLSGYAAVAGNSYHPDILLADQELANPPIHLAIVGGKADPGAQALHAAALRYPTDYLQVDWWDRSEGPLPDPTITYPVLPRAAAFACTANACSTPVYDAAALQERVRAIMN
jgi:uncharacterized protein